MEKSKKIFIILIVFLLILLTIMIVLYFNELKIYKNNLAQIDNLNKKIENLEELDDYKNSSVEENKTNTLNTNSVNSSPYVPDNIPIDNSNDNSGTKATDIEFDTSPDNVSITVIENTITNTSAEILIKDTNEISYEWGESFRLQEKSNNTWNDATPIKDLNFVAIAHNLDYNHELVLKINYGDYYGTLKNGTYRIVKTVYNNKYIDIYSNEFIIK